MNSILLVIASMGKLFAAGAQVYELNKPIEFQGKTLQGRVTEAELSGLENLPVKLGQNAKDAVLTMTDAAGKSKRIHTCREYGDARKLGFDADDTYDLSMESFFKSTCPVVTLLKSAKPPTAAKSLSLDDLEQMPSELIVNLSGSSRKTLKQNDIHDKSLADFAKKPTFKVLKSSGGILNFEFEGMRTELEEVVRADFDNSGKEQALVFKADYATEGSYRHYDYFILTLDGKVAKAKKVTE